MRPGRLIPFLPFNELTLAVILLVVAVVVIALLAVFKNNLYNRLSTRITVLTIVSGLFVLIMALAFNEITRDTLSPVWLRQLQIGVVVIGGPVVLGLLAARFVRRPLRQFNDAIASLEENDHRVQLQPTGIREFDEVFAKFNSLIKRLQQEEKLRKDLVSDTSHELNTPLTVMIGQLTAMQEGKYTMTKERVDLLKEQAERLADLVWQLDTYTKARIADTAKPEAIQMMQVCEELVRQFSLELKEKGMTAKVHVPKDVVIRADRGALQQMLANLMQNTLRYSQATEVTVEVTPTKIIFSDNGKGVPPDSLPYLFERFYRVDQSRNRTAGGLGLGLAIVKELALRQGWHIRAKDAQPGLAFVITVK